MITAPINQRLARMPRHPFERLRALLDGLSPPAGVEPLILSLGDPQHAPPPLLTETLAANADQWGRYPPNHGTPDLCQAIADWLTRRYGLDAGAIDATQHVLPVAGTREALFMFAGLAVPETTNAADTSADGIPAVLVSNPNYHVYPGAVAMAGAEPIYLPAAPETGFLPDLDAIGNEALARAALFYLCSPANPQGAVADREYLMRAIRMARDHGFILAVDECYAEIYDSAPPPGALEACAALGGGPDTLFDNVVVFHSLSKRSNAAGLRSGFVAGDASLIGAFKRLRAYASAMVPLPVQAAAAALWRDEAHAAANRDQYRAKFDAAERLLAGRFDFYRPAGGFYLWLNVGDGEMAAKRLWTEAGIRVLPGAYMGQADANGVNPGAPYIRIALVNELSVLTAALERLVKVL